MTASIWLLLELTAPTRVTADQQDVKHKINSTAQYTTQQTEILHITY